MASQNGNPRMNFVPRASYAKPSRAVPRRAVPSRNDGRAMQESAKRSWPPRGRWLFCLWVVRPEASGSGSSRRWRWRWRCSGGVGDGEENALAKGARTCPSTARRGARPAVVEDEVTDWDRGHGCTGSRLYNTKSTTAVAMAAGECGDSRELATVP